MKLTTLVIIISLKNLPWGDFFISGIILLNKIKKGIIMETGKIAKIIGIIAMLFSVYMFFDSRGGKGFFVLLIGVAIYAFGKKSEKDTNYVPR